MKKNFTIFLLCCVLCLTSLMFYNSEISAGSGTAFMNSENIGIPKPLRKFVPTPFEVDVTKMCHKICDREMKTCFDPKLSVFVYNGTSPEKMSFEQRFNKFIPKIHTEEDEYKWKHNRSLCPVNELDESLQTMTKQESCAIVGNSGILLGSECGEEIDSHDFVLRANLALLENYTKDVGNKTNMMMFNFATLGRIYGTLRKKSKAKEDMLRYFKLLNGPILWYPKGTDGSRSKRLRSIAALLLQENITAKFAFNFMTATGVTKGKWRIPRVASSGLIAFTMAQTFCKRVTLFGFYPYQRDEFGVPVLYHYYEPKLLNFHTSAHNFDREHRMFRSMHDQQLLKLVIGSCRNRNDSAGLRPIPDQRKVEVKPDPPKPVCNLICNRQYQSCFHPSLAIIVYKISLDPRKMSFQQTFPNFDIIMNDKDTHVGNIKKDSNDAKLCPITDIDPSFTTMTAQESCAIVGNRGIGLLLNSKCGKEIDSHDFVFRVNMPEVDEPLEDVGKRANITMLNLEIVDAMYDTLFARRRTSQRKRNHGKLMQAVRNLNESILWYPGSTASAIAKKLQRIAAFFRSQKMNVRFGYSFTDATTQTKRRWKSNEDPTPRLTLLTVAETFCKKMTFYGIVSNSTEANRLEANVDKFYNETKIFESLQEKGVLQQALSPCS